MNPRARRGSALITVVFFITILALLTTSILKYSSGEQRMNERQRLVLRSRNMTENVVIYASEQITNKLYKLRRQTPMAFLGDNAIALPPNDVLTTHFSTPADVEVRAGLTTSTRLHYIDPDRPENATHPNAGLQVSNSTVPIIGRSTMRHPVIGEVATYAEHNLEVAMIPLFQFAIFYNMDLEFGPGPNMTISGPVHTNGDFIARIQTGFANTIRFTDRVTSAKGFYANTAHRGPTYMADGAVDNGPGGTGPLFFRKPTDPPTGGTDVKSSDGTWRDHKWGGASETETTRGQFRSFATTAYAGNLRTVAHGVTTLRLPAIGEYSENDPVARKNGRQVIEAPAATDAGGVLGTKFSRNAGLYIVVNPDDEERTGRLPDGTAVQMRARSYRAFLNSVVGTGSHSLTEVVLPGQPSYGPLNAYVNQLPNAYRANTAVGHNQILRIPQGGGVDLADTGYAGSGAAPGFDSTPTPAEVLAQDAYFYDMRRSFNNVGFPFNRSATTPFVPRPIAKIDFDMTRFRMAVERTLMGATSSRVYYPSHPRDNATWNAFIFNTAAAPAAFGLGLAEGADTTFGIFPAHASVAAVERSATATYAPGTITIRGYAQTGATGPVNPYAGRFVIAETTGANPDTAVWSDVYTSTADEGSVSHAPLTPGARFIRVRQYLAGGAPAANRLTDEQIIPIVDAITTTVTATLTNDFLVVPSSAGGSTPVFSADAATEMRVYIGGVDDTANWTYTAATSAGVSGSFGSGPLASRYTVTGMTSASTSTVTLTANKSGYSAVSKTFRLEKQSNRSATLGADQTGRWLAVNGLPAPDPFRIYRAPANPTQVAGALVDPLPYALTIGNFVTSGGASPWYDGITVYIHSVDAENLTVTGTGFAAARNRVDSGVRLWNGRGSLVTLPGATYPGRTGLSFVTNDCIYIMGHYNADGSINSNINSVGVGGYSGRYPEAASEMLTSVMGDAISIFSQPVFTRAGSAPNYYYYQSSGWADSLSGSVRDASAAWASTWMTSNPGSGNTLDGLRASVQPALMPNLTIPSSIVGPGPRPRSADPQPAARTAKFSPSETEVSTCLLTGIVPTVKATSSEPKQTSGGVHNFPRLSENWAGTVALWIRGSLVAMFESQVGTEPWGIRWYQGAIRNWGLHESLRNEDHDVPLEPIVLNARRMSYRELTAAEYADLKTIIEALPH